MNHSPTMTNGAAPFAPASWRFLVLLAIPLFPGVACGQADTAGPEAEVARDVNGIEFAKEGNPRQREPVNRHPLDVQVVPAFPNLQWPGWLTGEDEGRVQDVLPIAMTGAGDGTNRLFMINQPGRIIVFKNDPALTADGLGTFLDIRDKVQYSPRTNEEGLLGLAFHPNYAQNGEFFICYSTTAGEGGRRSVFSRFKVSANDPNRADPNSEEVILEVPQPNWNHNGGTIEFGPDGFLYIVLGDGGSAGDPQGNGQNLGTLLGSILRIDVNKKDPGLAYAIPPDNPFVGREGARGEIWAYGVRNPWRLTFDRQTGTAWAGDVGQDLWEEIIVVRKGGNYGWNVRESFHPYDEDHRRNMPRGRRGAPRPIVLLPAETPPPADMIEPVWEYHHDVGRSITGGYVYRGSQVPELVGAYLYADYVNGQVWGLWYDESTGLVTANRLIQRTGAPIVTFGQDDNGEVYFNTMSGMINKFASPAQSEAGG